MFALYALLVIGVAVVIVPFFWMLMTSLMTLGESLNRAWIPAVPQWDNYIRAWDEANFGEYFVNSIIITVVTVFGILIMSTLAAYAFARIKFPGRELIFALLLTTLMIPESVTMIPNFLGIRGDVLGPTLLCAPGNAEFMTTIWGTFFPCDGWINTLQALSIPFMGSAFSIFLLRQFFAQIPWELWDAARIDGAGHLRFLVQIVLPNSLAPIMTVAIFAFIGAWNSFLWPLIVTTEDTWRPLAVGLYNFVTDAGSELNLMMAGSVITIVPILILYFFTQKQFTEGIVTSGLKG
ncbi:MAG: carbohydrate ABC transporter permease [Chloroflexi bacterium]|nr:carbohydrate ABC transporter permease [Chloroflexota bacterium]